MPILTEQLDHALCKLSWAPSGQLVAVGDVDGALHVFEAGEVRTDGWGAELFVLHFKSWDCIMFNSVNALLRVFYDLCVVWGLQCVAV